MAIPNQIRWEAQTVYNLFHSVDGSSRLAIAVLSPGSAYWIILKLGQGTPDFFL